MGDSHEVRRCRYFENRTVMYRAEQIEIRFIYGKRGAANDVDIDQEEKMSVGKNQHALCDL